MIEQVHAWQVLRRRRISGMKIVWISLTLLLMLNPVTASRSPAAVVAAVPEYARWGALAVKETRARYNAAVVDYKHLGRSALSPVRSEERFKLWLRDRKGKEFGVYVYIQFNPKSNTVHSIRFVESDR